ncbi:MAG: hypothetical protein IKW02_04235 [Clostridia bacterium]|nr:hypothetical protein [Clostridia bacterium]
MEERDILIKRLKDLARKRDSGNYCLFSPFLSPDIFPDVKSIAGTCLFGGYPDAERCVAAFLPDYMSGEDADWPISLLVITPTDGKTYSHRDYLGSLMGLGIKRQVLGDLMVSEGKAYLFCLESIEEFIMNNLTGVSGARVTVEKAESLGMLPERQYEEVCGTVASERLDCVVALAAKTSRTKAAEFISAGFVMVNSRETDKVTYIMKTGDRFSIRGKGKFVYDGAKGSTKKGRTVAVLRKYI